MKKRNVAIILLAGLSSRIFNDLKVKKQFYPLEGKELFLYSLETFISSSLFDKICLVIDDMDREHILSLLAKLDLKGIEIVLTCGGKDRNESVFNGLCSFTDKEKYNVFIHDSARPLISNKLLMELDEKMNDYEALSLAIPVHDSVIRVKEDIRYEDRENLYLVQTPQVFDLEKIYSIYTNGYDKADTDDFKKAIRASLKAGIVRGEAKNFKITEIDDIKLLENWHN